MISGKDYADLLMEIDDISTYPQVEDQVKIAYIQRVIKDFKNKHAKINPPTIKEIVASKFLLPSDSLNILTRSDRIKEARQVAMWFYHRYSKLSLGRIGEEFSNGQHTYAHCTVLHAIKRINGLIETDKQLRKDMQEITEEVEIYYEKSVKKRSIGVH